VIHLTVDAIDFSVPRPLFERYRPRPLGIPGVAKQKNSKWLSGEFVRRV
jgi:hypothetical protein